ncbi:hypothetical protein FRC17_007625 [Serendipita sp. 399]|nr:hypothetical protein FRC17_007625 [Serendipita sp. 399]
MSQTAPQTSTSSGEHTLSQQHERESLPPRHRAASSSSQPAGSREKSTTTVASISAHPSNTTGRSGGRSLPPPRFQRKQRPPRVQQALAAGVTSKSPQTTARTRRSNAPAGAGGHAGSSPANWPSGSNAVASLTMAEVNAASARGSIIHNASRQATTTAAEDTASLPSTYTSPISLYDGPSSRSIIEFENLDPVQLHNRITFGMGTQSKAFTLHPLEHTSSSGSLSEYTSADAYLPEASYQQSLNVARARSQSHSHDHHQAYDVGMSSTVFALSGYPGAVPDEPQLRTRSRSLITPSQIGVHSPQQPLPFPLVQAGPVMSLKSSSNPHEHLISASPRLVIPDGPTSANLGKPLKSALKNRKSVPSPVDIIPSLPSVSSPVAANSPGVTQDHGSLYLSTLAIDEAPQNAGFDAGFALPDSLQAQYAEQLRLLQQEYSVKAAKAERNRQRSAERVKSLKDAAAVPMAIVPQPEMSTHSFPTEPTVNSDIIGEEEHVISHSVVDMPIRAGPKASYAIQITEGYDSWDEEWNSNPTNHLTNRPRAFSDATSGGVSGTEDDMGSDVGDRGHGEPDKPHIHDQRMAFSDSIRSRSLSSLVSHIASGASATSSSPIASPSGAVYHGVDPPSPSTLSLAGAVSSRIQVEVIAPTPLMRPKELENDASSIQDASFGLTFEPQYDVAATISTTLPAVASIASPRTSGESSGSSDSNNTIIRGSIGKLLAESPGEEDVIPGTRVVSMTPSTPRLGDIDSVAVPPSLSRPSEYIDHGVSEALPTLHTSVTRSTRGISAPNSNQNINSTTPSYRTFSNVNDSYSIDYTSTQEVLSSRRLSSMPSVSSVTSNTSSHKSNIAFPAPTGASTLAYQQVDSRRSRFNPQDAASTSSHATSAGTPDDFNLHPRSLLAHRPPFANIDLSSSASVESGSSYGGNSGASHLSRPYERALMGSFVNGHGYTEATTGTNPPTNRRISRADILPSINSSSDSVASGVRHAPTDTSYPIKSMESVEFADNASTKGGALLGPARALGGDSIWTLGKDEEAQWPTAAPPAGRPSKSIAGMVQDASVKSPRTSRALPTDQLNIVSSAFGNGTVSGDVAYSRTVDSQPAEGTSPFSLRPQHSSPTFASPSSNMSGEVISVLLHPHELEQLKALRAAQIHSNNTNSRLPSSTVFDKGLPSQAITRSLPSLAPESTPTKAIPSYVPAYLGSVRPQIQESSSRPSTAITGRSSHSGESGESAGRRSIVALPASGGVFPRYQEFTAPSFESQARPGSSRGRFKSLFRGRDSRVFK